MDTGRYQTTGHRQSSPANDRRCTKDTGWYQTAEHRRLTPVPLAHPTAHYYETRDAEEAARVRG